MDNAGDSGKGLGGTGDGEGSDGDNQKWRIMVIRPTRRANTCLQHDIYTGNGSMRDTLSIS